MSKKDSGKPVHICIVCREITNKTPFRFFNDKPVCAGCFKEAVKVLNKE